MFLTSTFYKFVSLENPFVLQKELLAFCKDYQIKGTILLAKEGINGTVSAIPDHMERLFSYLRSFSYFSDLERKNSNVKKQPFYRMKVKVKKEIVTLGVKGINPAKKVGTYINPEDWNTCIQQPDVFLIDTRNDYETMVGTFKGALDPKLDHFTQFPDFVEKNLSAYRDKKIAMMCTGGIRCEKASAYLLEKGFKEVYHLKGGILKYLEVVPKEESLWEGECFVFDQRVTVNHNLQQGNFLLCYGCRYPVSKADKDSHLYEEGVSCPRCYNSLTLEQKERFRQRQKQVVLAHSRGEAHIGKSR